MLQFEGDRDLPQAPAVLWAKLSDARFLGQCIPDLASVSRSEPDQLECKVRPGLAFVRGTLDLKLQVAEKTEPSAVRLLLHNKGIGSSAAVEVTLTLAPQGQSTRVHWIADIKELGGLLKAVPQGLIKAAAQKVIADAWAAMEAKLNEAPGAQGT
jgi:carbon monoxide dehydrogenase subunit G